ncbi:aminotransferase class I/II-fold pyridoxal phosphate-dependent enzyme [uncultured Bacteroides sp.]|uniref:aminotransferase class I/II-fold pyridoxal phosphate-dependent enzyme n=1 Tax=uncultured Bacteroides sp. TaxID=162156 RepID=UPI00262D843B|nr:aminotransferase class I/II-fold pyridoxal phosphate-dependent enzyme [uncultured Bacteroides sp.]
MQAIILAAGMGRRLGKMTENNTKCMVSVNGVPLIDRMLNQLSKLNLSRVIIVVGYMADGLKLHIGNRYNGILNIEFIYNPIYNKTNNIYSLALAKEKMLEDDTLLFESDLIFEDRLLNLLIQNSYPNLALVAKYESWMDGTMVCIDEDNNIVNFVPKNAFNTANISSYYKTVNIYKFSKDFIIKQYIPFLDAYCKALGYNEYYEQVLRVITFLDNTNLKALPISDEKWYEIDNIQDLDIAQCIFADEDELLKQYYGRYGGFWRFPSLIDYCYLVNPYFPPQKMIDEMQSNFKNLLTEYPSGMRINSLLSSLCFEINQNYILPGNGAAEFIKILMEDFQGKLGLVYPTFEEYPNRLKRDNLEIFIPRNEDFHYTAEDLISYFTLLPINALLLINPDNPAGNFIPFDGICKIADWCLEKNIKFILDESFIDFSSEYKTSTMLKDCILESYPNMVVLKSISKSYGVPGIRLGILASADVNYIGYLKKKLPIWNINSFAESFMQIYIKYKDVYNKSCDKFQIERKWFYNELKKISYIRVIPSEANFFLVEIINKYSSRELTEKLLKKFYILVKDCGPKYGINNRNFVRISIRNREDNKSLIKALKELE